jgi:hypothetical protein
MTAINMEGKKCGGLLVIKRIENYVSKSKKSNYAQWFCLCDCGNYTKVIGKHLRSGHTYSCGCLLKQTIRAVGINNYKGKGIAAYNQKFRSYQISAKQRGYKFLLTKQEFINLSKQNCFYCGDIGKPFKVPQCRDSINFNGIDRIDSMKDYIVENCVTCCKICNYSKHALNQNDFFDHIKKVYERHLK